ncbi:hypothetical protein K438DRAFT_1776325 [Mycena galopus ATCC 62051]|nr:hypothetical protein K438DRAFT_1776325 [Mycena galopus ATCC 62051]
MADLDPKVKHRDDVLPDALPEINVTTPPGSTHEVPDSTAVAVEAAYPYAAEHPAFQDSVDKFEDNLSVPFDKAHNVFDELSAYYMAHASTINSAGNALKVDLDLKSIERTFTKFAETSKVLVDGLDLLGKLHPFLGGAVSSLISLDIFEAYILLVAVLPFKLMVTLDLTRRQNNRKVLAVKAQIHDTMSVLFRLRHMRDHEMKAPDGTILSGLSDLVETIADDIKASQMFKSLIYEARFEDYMARFEDHKKNLAQKLAVHIAEGVETANEKLDRQGKDLTFIKEKFEALFRKLETPREQNVRKFIAEKGSLKACLENDAALRELIEKSGESLNSFAPTERGKNNVARKDDIANAKKALTDELAEDMDKAFMNHMRLFSSKLEAQQEQLTDAMNQTGEHVISVVIGFLSGGVHTKVKDPDLKAIWEQRKWTGSVAARDFVLALNEYYAEKFHSVPSPAPSVAGSALNSVASSRPPSPVMSAASSEEGHPESVKSDDESWALAYINVAHLQPLLDVIDTDGTGMISIKEANHFARLRPHDCSLLSWLAFWAAGWHVGVTWYKNRIYKILAAMLSLVQRIKPANRNMADGYFAGLEGVQRVELLLRSTRSAQPWTWDDTQLLNVASAFDDAEAEKLGNQLKRLRYELDDITTLRLTTGLRRIERIELYVYPLVYQLLLRHFDIMRLACVHVLQESEFVAMRSSLATIFRAVDQRAEKLAAIFKSNAQDVEESLNFFAFGMFRLFYGNRARDPINNTIARFQGEDGFENADDLGPDSDDDEPTANAVLARLEPPNTPSILLYEPWDGPKYVYDLEKRHPLPVTLADPVDGLWTGELQFPDGTAPEGTLSMVLTRTADKLTGVAENYLGVLDVAGTVEGQNMARCTITWPDGYAVVCTGQYDPGTDTIAGSWEQRTDIAAPEASGTLEEGTAPSLDDTSSGVDESVDQAPGGASTDLGSSATNSTDSRFLFHRAASLEYKNPRFTENSGWEIAIAALDERARRFVDLIKRQAVAFRDLSMPQCKPLNDEENTEILRLKTDLHSSDARFYKMIADFELQQVVDHGRECDSCHRDIWDTRLFCIQCMDERYHQCIDLCSDCHEKTPQNFDYGFIHMRSHLLIKTVRRIHDAEVAWIIPEAKVVAKRVKKRSKDAQAPPSRSEGAPQSSSHAAPPKSQVQLRCCACDKPVSHPFWVCIHCVEDTYVCLDCDAKRTPAKPDGVNPTHKLSHPLVELLDNEPTPEPVTDVSLMDLLTRTSGLETKIAALETKLESRFAALEAILNGREEKLSAAK